MSDHSDDYQITVTRLGCGWEWEVSQGWWCRYGWSPTQRTARLAAQRYVRKELLRMARVAQAVTYSYSPDGAR